MRGPTNLEGWPVFIGYQAKLPLAIQERTLAEFCQGVAGQVLPGPSVVCLGWFAD
jgi:hypothetical protein